MNTLKIIFVLILIFVILYILRNIASYFLYELETADYSKVKENVNEDNDKHRKVIEKNKFVNESHTGDLKTSLPRDASKVQNLNKKFNVGTYRGSDGRYKSLKNVKSKI